MGLVVFVAHVLHNTAGLLALVVTLFNKDYNRVWYQCIQPSKTYKWPLISAGLDVTHWISCRRDQERYSTNRRQPEREFSCFMLLLLRRSKRKSYQYWHSGELRVSVKFSSWRGSFLVCLFFLSCHRKQISHFALLNRVAVWWLELHKAEKKRWHIENVSRERDQYFLTKKKIPIFLQETCLMDI